MRDPSENAGRFVAGLDVGEVAALVVLERLQAGQDDDALSGVPLWRNDAIVVGAKSLHPGEGLPTMIRGVSMMLGSRLAGTVETNPLHGDVVVVVNLTSGDHARRLLLGTASAPSTIAMRLGPANDPQNIAVSEETLWADVLLARQQKRLTVSDRLPRRQDVRAALAQPALRPGLATALALAVQWWKRTSATETSVFTRRPSQAEQDRASTEAHWRRAEEDRLRRQREDRAERAERGDPTVSGPWAGGRNEW